ncbi:MAG TPA: hypothetical protein VH325_08650 [Bryobacteraceae bacterium]|nr:hypothetical protein [Bryobacteraceae bacterium]
MSVRLTSFVLGLTALGLQAQQLDKGKPYVDKALEALGGDTFLHMQTRAEQGRVFSFFHDQISGLSVAAIYTEYLDQKPAKGVAVREREVFGKKQDWAILLLPDQGWEITFRGARPMEDENWNKYLQTTETSIFYLLRERSGEPGFEYDYIGTDLIEGAQVDVIDITDSKGQTIRVSFDHITHLPVRQVYKWIDPVTKYHNDEVTDYDKYRDAGNGVKWPYTIERERNGYKTYEIFSDHVEVNRALPPKTFELPSGAKILHKVE